MQKTMSTRDYFKSLSIKLSYHINDFSQVSRIADLLGKTNQFILTYARYKEDTILDYMSRKDYCVITISMSDKLSDSGLIGILVAHVFEGNLYLDELTVSCRALGRK